MAEPRKTVAGPAAGAPAAGAAAPAAAYNFKFVLQTMAQ